MEIRTFIMWFFATFVLYNLTMILCSLALGRWVKTENSKLFSLFLLPFSYYIFIAILSLDDLHKNYDNLVEAFILAFFGLVYLAIKNKRLSSIKLPIVPDVIVAIVIGLGTAAIPALSLFVIDC